MKDPHIQASSQSAYYSLHPNPGEMCAKVADAIAELVKDGGDLAAPLRAIRARLDEPLRVAVAGRVSSGKSTLVNALLGTRIAQTGATETTNVLTRYIRGEVERVEVRLHDGSTRRLSLSVDGQLPPTIGVPLGDVKELVVQLPKSEILKAMTLVDTPGLSGARSAG